LDAPANAASKVCLVHDDAQKGLPGLLMVPNWMGVNESAVSKARQLAQMGYVVLVADVYGVDMRPQDRGGRQCGGQRPCMRTAHLLRSRAGAALDQLIAQADTGVDGSRDSLPRGFCFGGSTVLELARSGRR
jgi:dienelactone hydrolase